MIHPLLVSEVTLPPSHPRAGEHAVVQAFVIDLPYGVVLVDTGVGVGHGRLDELYRPTHHPIEEGLTEIGFDASDVRMIINTHLHFDHCGNNRLFPGVPAVVQVAELTAARTPRYTIPEWIDFPGANWVQVEGFSEAFPGVTVIPTPGHTAGHQSVYVEIDGRVELIAGQTVYDPAELEAGASAESLAEGAAEDTAASTRLIKELNPRRVYFSHSRDVWTPPGAPRPARQEGKAAS